jgi:ATP-dependent protease ClpP protease subunit
MNILFEGCRINQINRIKLEFEINYAIGKNPEEINLLFATQGGEIYEALLFYKFIQEINYPINIFNIGEINSCGIIIFLAFKNRYFLPSSKFLLHSVRLINDAMITEEKISKSIEFNNEMLEIIVRETLLPQKFLFIIKDSTEDIIIEVPDEIIKYEIAKSSEAKFKNDYIKIDCD